MNFMEKNDKNQTIQELKDLLLNFRDQRNWKKFHNPKDLSSSISIEANELLELFLWKTNEEIEKEFKKDKNFKEEIEDELADVVICALNFSNTLNLDVAKAVKKKIMKNGEKYSVEKAKDNAVKYNKL